MTAQIRANEVRNNMKRVAALALSIALLPVIAWSATHAGWNYSLFPEAIRSRIALSASEMPPFPLADSTLLDPRSWPRTTTFIGGDSLYLRVVRLAGSGSERYLIADDGDLSLTPGQELILSYMKRDGGLRVGPDFVWNGEGHLVAMRWHRPDSLNPEQCVYLKYPSGRLMQYYYSTSKRLTNSEGASSLLELFDETGTLRGVIWSEEKKGTRYWWDGRSVKRGVWLKKRDGLG